jgi:hypothetical protein
VRIATHWQQWMGDLGLGYRWIKNDAAILGWYVFAGRTRVANNSSFWITNPGFEVMGSRWDARVNAYIPVAGRSNEVGLEELNTVSAPFFTGHTEVINSVFNNVNEVQQIGNGVDAKLGYQIIRHVPLKAYVGAYFFSIPNSNNISGGAAGAEYWFDRNVKAFVNYSYDNYQHSKVVGGLGISFGGVRQQWADPTLSERLTDPVERYLANLGHGSGIPSRTILYGMGNGSSSQIVLDNIAFFSQSGTPNTGGSLTLTECTFENPCGPNDFTQTGVNDLNTLLPKTLLYFNGGTYPADNAGDGITLNNGQSVHSRTANYAAVATGTGRSTFNGGFLLTGNNQLDSVILNFDSGLTDQGVLIDGAQNIMINNTDIGSSTDPYPSALDLNNATAVTLTESNVFFKTNIAVSDSSLVVQSSSINAITDTNPLLEAFAITGSNLQINDSQLNVIGSGSLELGSAIAADNASSVLIDNSTITVNLLDAPNAQAFGFQTNTSEIQMNSGNLSVSSNINAQLTMGSNIVFNGVACALNGSTVVC